MRRAPIVLTVLLPLTVAAPGASAASAEFFQLPSKRIGCVVFSGKTPTLRCDINGATNRPPAKPRSCEFDFGFSFGLSPRGKARRLCVSDAGTDPEARILRYGQRYRRFGFTCTSRQSGLTCTNRDGRGFRLARASQRLF